MDQNQASISGHEAEVSAENGKRARKHRELLTESFDQEMEEVRELMRAARWASPVAENGDLVDLRFSDSFRQIFGFTDHDDFPDGVEFFSSRIHPDDRDRMWEAYYAAALDRTDQTAYDTNYRIQTKDGSFIWVRDACVFRRDDEGRPTSAIGVFVDINDAIVAEHSHQELLEQAFIKADLANKAKTEFLHRMSHDMRTPLNGILGLISISNAHPDDIELAQANRKKMEVAAKHLLSLINDVLQSSRLEDGSLELAHEPIDLLEMTEDIVCIIIDKAIEKGITWEYVRNMSAIPFPYAYGSELHLRQVLLNIYGNCIKYNQQGGKITTSIDSWKDEDGRGVYRWTISDTGIGMSEDFVRHIFEPFTQEMPGARSDYEGTGLGMSIVKKLVDLMGGTIEVRSVLGEGSTFTVTIPFDIAPAPAKQPCHDEANAQNIDGVRILMAEDNKLNAEIAQTLLEDAGATVTVARNGKIALEIFEEESAGTFDVILMDIMMPIMDGYAATRAIRALKRPDARSIPILAMTANAFDEDRVSCFAAGMNDHLAKPLDMSKVKDAIARALATR